MPTPFPGMDPYLERPDLWPEIHTRLIVALADMLGPLVYPHYRVAVEQRTYLSTVAFDDTIIIPDVSVVNSEPAPSSASLSSLPGEPEVLIAELPMPEERSERYLEIRSLDTQDIITSIEILSPSNKRSGEGRRQYEEKRLNVLGSQTHLVEIDLLRAGASMPMRTSSSVPYDYSIIVSRAYQRPQAEIRLFSLRQSIPSFPAPLRRGEREPTLALNTILHDLYDRASYNLLINYRDDAIPPLSQDDTQWADALLKEKNLRS